MDIPLLQQETLIRADGQALILIPSAPHLDPNNARLDFGPDGTILSSPGVAYRLVAFDEAASLIRDKRVLVLEYEGPRSAAPYLVPIVSRLQEAA